MADIYRKASTLVVWLGHGITKEEDQDVMDVLCIFRGEEVGKPLFLELKGILPEHDQAHMHAEESRGVFQSQEAMPPIEYVPQQSTLIQFVPCLKWLRLAPGNSEAGRLLRRRMQSDFSPSDIPGLQQSEAGVKELQESGRFKKTGTAMARLCETLMRLCQRRYFTRRWILQELFHSKCVQLRWGVFSISADEFRQRLNDMDTLFQSSPWSTNLSQQRIYNHTLRVLSVHDAMQPTLMPTRSGIGGVLVECLCKFQSTVCADDRDRIYALMSIAGKTPLLAVNYHLTACQLFVAFAGKLIQQNLLDLVIYVASWQQNALLNGRNSRMRATDLPTWVPDLACAMPECTSQDTLRLYMYRSHLILEEGTVLQCRANIGRLAKFPKQKYIRHMLRGVRKGDYLFEAGQYRELPIDFTLHPFALRLGYFKLAGSWTATPDTREIAWDCCVKVGIRTIYIM